ncbi:MAG: hypothetical protein RSC12_01000 [Alistipes sp.]
MKIAVFYLLLLFGMVSVRAQEPTSTVAPSEHLVQEGVPSGYSYCEIMANHLPLKVKVLVDFGQSTKKWGYNYLKDEQGENRKFNSAVEALNFRSQQGWEFVQAYTSGENNEITHYLLRTKQPRL